MFNYVYSLGTNVRGTFLVTIFDIIIYRDFSGQLVFILFISILIIIDSILTINSILALKYCTIFGRPIERLLRKQSKATRTEQGTSYSGSERRYPKYLAYNDCLVGLSLHLKLCFTSLPSLAHWGSGFVYSVCLGPRQQSFVGLCIKAHLYGCFFTFISGKIILRPSHTALYRHTPTQVE